MKTTATKAAWLTLCSAIVMAPLGCGAGVEGDEPTRTSEEAISTNSCPDGVPASLKPAADQKLSFLRAAEGLQVYQCQAVATGFAWTLLAPDADLFDKHGNIVGDHFGGPTWRSEDGSSVVASRVASAPAPVAGAIPWLLLVAVSHDGEGGMDEVTSIQRLSTTGGVAPATGCDADHVGAVQGVPYTADYFFYETKNGNGSAKQCGD
jgi:hypothetical protein